MWKIFNTYNWQALEEKFSWVADMKGVEQDPVYHAEGDVATHTRMVMEELERLLEFEELDEQEQHILMAAALMHDIEKRSTTYTRADGTISSPNHAKNGESTVREILYRDIETPFEIREQIVKLVRFHGLPIWALEKENPEKVVVRASMEVNTKLLFILSKADVLGRIAEDTDVLLYKIELFREYCKELNCWGKPRYFDNQLAKYHYFTNDSHIDYIPFDNTRCEVTLLSALPGTGKDFYISKNLKNLPVISLDNLRRKYKADPTDKKKTGRIVQEAKEQAKIYLREQKSFVWNATNLSSSMRKALIEMFVQYKARVKIVYLEVPYQKLIKQNIDREYPLPQKVLDKMISKWEVPQVWEAHEVIHPT